MDDATGGGVTFATGTKQSRKRWPAADRVARRMLYIKHDSTVAAHVRRETGLPVTTEYVAQIRVLAGGKRYQLRDMA